jgi:hypothetical protein
MGLVEGYHDRLQQDWLAATTDPLAKIHADLEVKRDLIPEVSELYYDIQKMRVGFANRTRSEGPSYLGRWLNEWLNIGEQTIFKKLKEWVESDDSPAEAKWCYQQDGCGPVLASGLAAHIDLAKAPTPSSLWKFAGLAPGFDRRVRGQKLAYNARLKTLAWKLGECLVKVSGKQGAVYGKLYADFKADETRKNESGQYRAVAERELASKDFKKDTVTKKRLLEGKLTDGHLHSRAKRKAVKILLQNYWLVGRKALGLPIPEPYVQAHLGHGHIVEPVVAQKSKRSDRVA